nr:hypothetical protein [Aeromicrobium sp.]
IQERDRIDQHIIDLLQTRDSLDGLIAINREHRATHKSDAPVVA